MSGLVYGLLWLFFNASGRILFRFKTVGREHIPKHGGVLVAANHASYLDILFLGCAMRRRAVFLGREDLFGFPGMRGILRWLGWIPIRLDRLDREGFGQAIRLINDGNVVVIYPEGGRTRDGELKPGKPGVGLLVAATGCTVIPAYLAGTYEVLPITASWIRLYPVTVRFGAPIDFGVDMERYTGKDLYRHVSRTVMERIAELGHVPPPNGPSGREPATRALNAE